MSVAVLDEIRELIDEGRPPKRKYGWQRPEDEALGGQIVAGAARVASTTCAWLLLVAEFERRDAFESYYGINSTAHFLTWAAGVGSGAAREHVRVARTLESMPLVCEAFAAGELSYSKVRECTRVADMVNESELVEAARGMTASQLERAIREFRRGRADRIEQQLRREVSWRTEDDGTVTIRASLPAEEAAIVIAALDKAARADHDAHLDDPETVSETDASLETDANLETSADLETDANLGTEADSGDADSDAGADAESASGTADDACGSQSPTPRYNKADALVEIARAYCESGPVDVSGEDRDVVVVHISADDLAADADERVPAGTRGASGTPSAQSDTATEHADSAHADSDPTADHADSAHADSDPTADHADSDHADSAHADSDQTAEHVDFDSPLPSLRRPAIPPAPYIAGSGAITIETAQRIACVGRIQPVVVDQDGEVLNLGRSRRLVSRAQRRALMVRDGSCQFPGCVCRRHLKAHHIQFWSRGGATDLDNLILLCQHHHTVVHEGSLTITGRPGGWAFTRIGGTVITAQHYIRRGEFSERLLLDHLLGDLTGIHDYFDPRSEVLFPAWGGERDALQGGRDAIWNAALVR